MGQKDHVAKLLFQLIYAYDGRQLASSPKYGYSSQQVALGMTLEKQVS